MQATALLTLFFAWNISQTFEELEAKRSVMIHRVKGPTDNDLKRRKIPCLTYGTDLSQRVHVLHLGMI